MFMTNSIGQPHVAVELVAFLHVLEVWDSKLVPEIGYPE
jgi:hypothetical protein